MLRFLWMANVPETDKCPGLDYSPIQPVIIDIAFGDGRINRIFWGKVGQLLGINKRRFPKGQCGAGRLGNEMITSNNPNGSILRADCASCSRRTEVRRIQ